ncbi:hypothetical protein FHS96_000362 [Sphingomonas zeicaulis]|uniref:Imm42 family immunity protein n=1 Tax=Sphingomonas zeicaulis TaxID=1632740 RepID=UPI003D225C43
MIVGDCNLFAIESEISAVPASSAQMALGFFIIHLGGRSFGVRAPDASMLGCSFNAVKNRRQRRGAHLMPMLTDIAAADIVDAFLDAIYRDTPRTDYFGQTQRTFVDALYASGSTWAPDGDEAFDDGSHILQFDVGNRVRIIAFVNAETPHERHESIREAWMDADAFYATLSEWLAWSAREREAIAREAQRI